MKIGLIPTGADPIVCVMRHICFSANPYHKGTCRLEACPARAPTECRWVVTSECEEDVTASLNATVNTPCWEVPASVGLGWFRLTRQIKRYTPYNRMLLSFAFEPLGLTQNNLHWCICTDIVKPRDTCAGTVTLHLKEVVCKHFHPFVCLFGVNSFQRRLLQMFASMQRLPQFEQK